MRNIFVLIVIAILVIPAMSCYDLKYQERISIPHRYQDGAVWCGPACVQMWALKDGNNPEQSEIAFNICGPEGAPWYRMEWAVNTYTNTDGVHAYYSSQDHGIAVASAAIKNNQPAILNYYLGDGIFHYVIINGVDWHEDWLQRSPIYDTIYFHDPIYGPDREVPIFYLKNYFYKKTDGRYNVIVGFERSISDGLSGYAEFLARGGTYYGGPKPFSYNPSAL